MGKQNHASYEGLNTAEIDYDDLVKALKQADERDDVIVTVLQGEIPLLVFRCSKYSFVNDGTWVQLLGSGFARAFWHRDMLLLAFLNLFVEERVSALKLPRRFKRVLAV